MGNSFSVAATAPSPTFPLKSAREVFMLENTCSTASAARGDDLDAVESTRDGAESSKDGVDSTRDGAESAKEESTQDAAESCVGIEPEPQDTLCVPDAASCDGQDAVESSVGIEPEPQDTLCAAIIDGQDPSEDGAESTEGTMGSSPGTAELELQDSVESTDDAVESIAGTVCELQDAVEWTFGGVPQPDDSPCASDAAESECHHEDCAELAKEDAEESSADHEPPLGGQWSRDGLAMTFEPSETLLIFDWDDTIMPTTWLAEEDLVREDVELSEEQQAVLQRIEDNAKALLNKAKAYGRVLIITNAAEGWVEESVRLFTPGLRTVLQHGVRVVSARAAFHEGARPDACGFPFAWKVKTFRAEADAHFSEQPEGLRRNVVCCGDSMDEYKACRRLETSMPDCRAKFVKFLPVPAPTELAEELESLFAALGEVINHDGCEQYDLGA